LRSAKATPSPLYTLKCSLPVSSIATFGDAPGFKIKKWGVYVAFILGVVGVVVVVVLFGRRQLQAAAAKSTAGALQ